MSNQEEKHSHYKKDVSHLRMIDVYRVLKLWGVTEPSRQHAIKKLLCAGQRGSKDLEKDLREAVDSINRELQMIAEDCNAPAADKSPARYDWNLFQSSAQWAATNHSGVVHSFVDKPYVKEGCWVNGNGAADTILGGDTCKFYQDSLEKRP